MQEKSKSGEFVIKDSWNNCDSFVTLTCYSSSRNYFICAEIDKKSLILRVHDFRSFKIIEVRGLSVESLKIRAFCLARSLGYTFENEKKMLTVVPEDDKINHTH